MGPKTNVEDEFLHLKAGNRKPQISQVSLRNEVTSPTSSPKQTSQEQEELHSPLGILEHCNKQKQQLVCRHGNKVPVAGDLVTAVTRI